MRVPLVDLQAQHAEVQDAVLDGLREVFAAASFIGGPPVAAFERAYADFIGAKHCVGVANGTDALELALRAVGVRPGGEVILPANTFIATAEAVSRIGALPVLVDVDPHQLLIDPVLVDKAVTSKTQAIVPVHLFGQPAPMESITEVARAHDLPVVEDAAQSQGARRFGRSCGTLGDIAATSFYPGKNLGAAGDAGAVTTDNEEIAQMVRLLGAHGSRQKYVHEAIGMNSRLDTVQAVVLHAKLSRLEHWNRMRRHAASRYHALLAGVDGVVAPESAEANEDVWHLYVVRVADRDRVLEELNRAGVGAGIHYPTPLHLTPAYSLLKQGPGSYPVAEIAAKEILSLPLYPHITVAQQEYVSAQLAGALSTGSRGG